MEYKNKRRLILSVALLLLLVLYAFKNYEFMIRVLGTILGLWIFYFFDHAFRLDFKIRHYIYATIILTLGILFSPLYYIYPSFDKIMHLTMPILASIFVFFIVNRMKIDFKWKLLITFMAMITLLTILEVGEYIIDYFWDYKLQGVYLRDITGLEKYNLVLDKNDDTMIDMMLGLLGSIIFIIGKALCRVFNKKYKKKFKIF